MENIARIPKPQIEFNPPIYQCKRATKDFHLDGDLNKEFWKDAEFTEPFVDIVGTDGKWPTYQTKVKMLWDEEYFYF